MIAAALKLAAGTVVLDYGCGIGRLARAMIEASGCSVIGVDISADMRRLALDYVQSDRFMAVTPGQFDTLVRAGLRVQAAIAVWVLQHCFAPADDIARIAGGLGRGGGLFVLNMPRRAVPAIRDAVQPDGSRFVWAHDGVDVAQLLRGAFRVAAEGLPDPTRTPTMSGAGAFWMSLRRDGP